MNLRALAATLPPMPGEVRLVREGEPGLSASPGAVAEIVLDAPGTRNALHPRMMVQLADAIEGAAGARVVLLRGENGTFCSGGDLGALRAHLAVPGAGAGLATFMHAATERLGMLAAVTVGIATGNALGGGAELLSACDLVYAAPDARIGWVQARMGVSPGFGGGARLVGRVGAARALAILLDARPMDAPEALSLGLVDRVVPDPLAAAREDAARWAALPAEVLAATLRVVRAARDRPRADALAEERAAFDGVWGGPAHQAALDRARRRG